MSVVCGWADFFSLEFGILWGDLVSWGFGLWEGFGLG